MNIKSVGIIGYGAFGSFIVTLLQKLASHVELRVYSSRSPIDGTLFYSLEDACDVDAIILCSPIHAYEETMRRIAPYIRPDTILVDVATVKVYTTELIKKLLPAQPYIATHPMFGPESYAKHGDSLHNLRVVITEHSLTEEDVNALTRFLTSLGMQVVSMTSDEHDKQLATTLFLTHYIGQIVHTGGFERSDIDTVSFGYLMDAVDSVRHDSALFKDVYTYNPYCKETLTRFSEAEAEVTKGLESKS
jgi:prephenate dehydrogenase